MQVLVIGGTGFIGSHVIKNLVDAGHDVTVFHRGETNCVLPSGVTELHGDRKDLPSFADTFRRLALRVVLDMIPYAEKEALDVIRTFRGIAERVVAVSSMDVYQAYGLFRHDGSVTPASLPFDEDAPLRSNLFPYREIAKGEDDMLYHYEKILVERAIMNDTNLAGTIVRLAKVYGAGGRQHLLFEYVKRMDDGRPAILLEEGKARWRWTRVYAKDAAAGIALAVADDRAANRIYNIGEAEALTEAQWVQSIGEAAGWKGKVVSVPRELLPKHLVEPYDWSHSLVANTTRVRRELGYEEQYQRHEALQESVDWERAHVPAEADSARLDYQAEDEVLLTLNSKPG
jgi:nucleoside-diphosphate-sugar epimerase